MVITVPWDVLAPYTIRPFRGTELTSDSADQLDIDYDTVIFILENGFENVTCKTAAILLQSQFLILYTAGNAYSALWLLKSRW